MSEAYSFGLCGSLEKAAEAAIFKIARRDNSAGV
jgi:hypothetical protein